MILIRNETVLLKDSGLEYRILWVSEPINKLVAIDINAANCKPEWFSLAEWKRMVEFGSIIPLPRDPHIQLVVENELSNATKKARDRGWDAISELVKAEPKIYLSDRRAAAIRDAVDATGLSKDSIRNYLQRYWQKGLNKNSLLAQFQNCGGRGNVRKSGVKKRGRPRKGNKCIGTNIDAENLKCLHVMYTNYVKLRKMSFMDAYIMMISMFYAEDVDYAVETQKHGLRGA